MSPTRSGYKELGLELVEPLQDQPRKSRRPPMADEKKDEGAGAMLHEAGTFFGSGDAKASFSKNLGSEVFAIYIFLYFFAFILKTNIPNTKLIVEDMKTCIFLHKSR